MVARNVFCEGCGDPCGDDEFCKECLPDGFQYYGEKPGPEHLIYVTPKVVAVYKKVRAPSRDEIEWIERN